MTVPPADPWSFGWDQLLALGNLLAIGAGIIVARETFRRWQDEKVASRQIEIAEEALAEAYEAEIVFDDIRSPFSSSSEGESRTKALADQSRYETEDDKRRRDNNHIPFERLNRHQSYWEKLSKTRVLVKAYFGADCQEIFDGLFKLRHKFILAANNKAIFSDGLADGAQGKDRVDYLANIRLAEKTIWKISPDDDFSKELVATTAAIEAAFAPLVRRKVGRRSQ
jgi:hypothetical protein